MPSSSHCSSGRGERGESGVFCGRSVFRGGMGSGVISIYRAYLFSTPGGVSLTCCSRRARSPFSSSASSRSSTPPFCTSSSSSPPLFQLLLFLSSPQPFPLSGCVNPPRSSFGTSLSLHDTQRQVSSLPLLLPPDGPVTLPERLLPRSVPAGQPKPKLIVLPCSPDHVLTESRPHMSGSASTGAMGLRGRPVSPPIPPPSP